MKKSVLGFTLVELLITISIIAILSAIGLIAYSTVMKQGRDAKRKSDLASIQSALENYHADQNYYPQSLGAPGTPLSGGGHTYLAKIPADITGSWYGYQKLPGTCDNTASKYCISYKLCAKLENQPTGTGCGSASYNFEVSPP